MIDTHAHLQDQKIENLNDVIINAKNAGVNTIVCASADLKSSYEAVEIAEKYGNIYATVGVHPHDAKSYNKQTEEEIKNLAKNKKCVAIGEIGLDYHYMFSEKEQQKDAFIKQIDLAHKLGLPVVIHTREASGDTMEILRANLQKLKHGVCIHCFNMSLEILKEIMAYGFYISVGGIVTFKNAKNVIDIVKACDINKLMLETDTPYLTPEPFRSKTNEPKYVPIIAQKLADILCVEQSEIARITTQNANRFFNLETLKDF